MSRAAGRSSSGAWIRPKTCWICRTALSSANRTSTFAESGSEAARASSLRSDWYSCSALVRQTTTRSPMGIELTLPLVRVTSPRLFDDPPGEAALARLRRSGFAEPERAARELRLVASQAQIGPARHASLGALVGSLALVPDAPG